MSATFVRALCCECGHLREVSIRAGRRDDDNKSCDDGEHPSGWRMTQTLKCANCKQMTRHATLRDDVEPANRNRAEKRMTGCPACPAQQGQPCLCPVSGLPLGYTHRGRTEKPEQQGLGKTCPVCGAKPGSACMSVTTGQTVVPPHRSRLGDWCPGSGTE